MPRKRKYIREAEEKIIATCKAFDDAMSFVDALQNFGSRLCKDYVGRPDFMAGIELIRKALWAEQNNTIRNLFCLAGVGSGAGEEYSRQMAARMFDKKNGVHVMHFLGEWGHTPSSYLAEDDEGIRKEVMEKLGQKDDDE